MGSPTALVRPERYWNFRDWHAQFCRLDDKLEREFHTGGPRIDSLVDALGETSHTAVCITDSCMEKIVQDACDSGIS